MLGDDLGGLPGAELGRADDRVRREADTGQELPEPVGLLLALARQRPGGVGAVQAIGSPAWAWRRRWSSITTPTAYPSAGEGQGLRSSTSPVTR